VSVCRQAMDELDVSDFKYGGVNLTGFAIINTSSARYQAAQRDWTRRNPNYWLGARRRLTVRHRITRTCQCK